MPYKIKILILCSLLGNLILAGIVIGQNARYAGEGRKMHRSFTEKLEKTSLSKEKKQLISNQLGSLIDRRKEGRKAVHAQHERLLSVLAAETFDAKIYQQEIDKMELLRKEQHQAFAHAAQKVAEQLTHEERKILVTLLRFSGKK